MNKPSLQARLDRLFTALNKEPDVQIVDCTGAREKLLKQLQSKFSADCSTPVTLDQDMVTGLKNTLQAQIEQVEILYNARFVSYNN